MFRIYVNFQNDFVQIYIWRHNLGSYYETPCDVSRVATSRPIVGVTSPTCQHQLDPIRNRRRNLNRFFWTCPTSATSGHRRELGISVIEIVSVWYRFCHCIWGGGFRIFFNTHHVWSTKILKPETAFVNVWRHVYSVLKSSCTENLWHPDVLARL